MMINLHIVVDALSRHFLMSSGANTAGTSGHLHSQDNLTINLMNQSICRSPVILKRRQPSKFAIRNQGSGCKMLDIDYAHASRKRFIDFMLYS